MKIRFSVDRVDENGLLAVCFDDDQNKYVFPASLVALGAGEMFLAELDGEGMPRNIEPLPEETAKRRRQLHSRTSALFNRNKKQ